MIELHHGDCLDLLPTFEANSVDTVITDPPYGLEFMGKEWDRFSGGFSKDEDWEHGNLGGLPRQRRRNIKCPECEKWVYDHPGRACVCGGVRRSQMQAFEQFCYKWAKEALRVTKPGGMLLVFGGTRTYHRMACAVEDAGWEIRDCLMWLYGSGFPKSHNVEKALRKKGHEKEADRFAGYGTALKPSWEPIIMAMKPIDSTFANNAIVHGVAGLNIDGSRIQTNGETPTGSWNRNGTGNAYQLKDWVAPNGGNGGNVTPAAGRFPSNLILSHHPACVKIGVRKVKGNGHWTHKREIGGNGIYGGGGYEELDEGNKLAPDGTETIPAYDCHPECPIGILGQQSGTLTSGGSGKRHPSNGSMFVGTGGHAKDISDSGTCARFFLNLEGETRFFYTAKASRGERNLGLEDGQTCTHPTVKSVALMKYLCTLTRTPTGGIVLDMFMGSGTTGVACTHTGRRFVGIEREREYFDIAKARIEHAQEEIVQMELAL